MAETIDINDFIKQTKGGAPANGSAQPPAGSGSNTPINVGDFQAQTAKAPPVMPAWATSGAPGPTMPPGVWAPSTTPPSTWLTDPPAAASRIGHAASEGYTSVAGGNLLTPEAYAALKQSGWLGRNLLAPTTDVVSDVGSRLLGVGAGALRGGQQAVQEAINPLDPSLARDVAAVPEYLGGDAAFQSRVRIGDVKPEVMNTPELVKKTYEDPSYKSARNSGATVPADFVNEGLDAIKPTSAEDIARAQASGSTEISKLRDRLDTFRDKPMDINTYIGLDKAVTDELQAARVAARTTGRYEDVNEIRGIQSTLRNHFENPDPSDITSGDPAGFDALKIGRAASSQRMKMEDVQDMWDKASKMDNPQTAFKTMVKNFTTNEAKTAGWSDDEIAALEDAGKRGVIGGTMHYLGNRGAVMAAMGIPAAAEMALTHGLPSAGSIVAGPVAGALTYAAGAPFRYAAKTISEQRMRNALDVLGQRVPTDVLDIPPRQAPPQVTPGPAPWTPRPQPAWGAWDNTPPGA